MAEEARAGHGEVAFYSVDTKGLLTPLSRLRGERETWSTIIAAGFGGTSRTDLLFYDPSAGEADVCFVDHRGTLARMESHSGWRKTWTHIVPGKFSEDPWSGLLFYDRASGDLELCRTDGLGKLESMGAWEAWRPGWDIVTPGRFFPGEGTDLLFYDRDGGVLALYSTDLQGTVKLEREYTDQFWDWDHIVALSAGHRHLSELLCYARRERMGRLYAVQHGGRLKHIKTHQDWSRGWDLITPMPVRGSETHRVLFYDRSIGFAQLIDLDHNGEVHLVREYDDWKKTWCTIVPGYYTTDGVTDLMFYDRFADFVEADKARHALGCRYEVLEALDGPLGVPVLDLERVETGWVRRFRRGDIYWRSDINANEVYGAILEHYRHLGGPHGPLGLPTSIPKQLHEGERTYQCFDGGVVVLEPDGRVRVHDTVTFELQRIEQMLPIEDGPEFRKEEHNAELVLRLTVRVNGKVWEGYDDLRIPPKGYMKGAADLGVVIRLPLTSGLRLEVLVRAFDVDLVGPDDYLGTWRMTYPYEDLVSRCLMGGERHVDTEIHEFEQKSDAVMGKGTLHLTYALNWGE